MKLKLAITVIMLFIFSSSFAEPASNTLSKPTAEEIIKYANIIKNNPKTDKELSTQVLQQWMDGTLQASASKPLSSPVLDNAQTLGMGETMRGSTEQCIACMGGCCWAFACNPACIAGCVAGVCK